jgi:RNA polymerase-interacting CarD/CdnL/TRCF family regulator
MRLAIGDRVVYASHGIGRVVARPKTKTGGEVVVLEFGQDLSVTLPVERARETLRPLAGKKELESVRATLRGRDKGGEVVWQKRLKMTQAKVAGGEPLGLAEVVRDAVHRERTTTARGEGIRLSLSERNLYLKARQLLAEEIGLARGIELAEADDWIGAQLSGTRSPK